MRLRSSGVFFFFRFGGGKREANMFSFRRIFISNQPHEILAAFGKDREEWGARGYP